MHHHQVARAEPAIEPIGRAKAGRKQLQAIADAILDGWADYLPKFVKVMPVEYRRALQELERQQESSDGLRIGMKRSA